MANLNIPRIPPFNEVIKNAMVSFESVGEEKKNHFASTVKMVLVGGGVEREVTGY